MAVTQSSPEFPSSRSDIDPAQLQRPQLNEGVFDSGEHVTFQGQVKVGRSVVNWELDVPENRQYDGLGIYIPGFFGVEQTSQAPSDAHANQGIAMAKFSPALRGDGSWWENFSQPQILHTQAILAVGNEISSRLDIQRRTPNIKEIDFGKKLLLAHSMGGLSASRFAEMEPGSVDMLFNLAACGFGHPTIGELALDVPRGMLLGVRHELLPSIFGGDIKPSFSNVVDTYKYFRRLRTIYEGKSCLWEDSRERVAKIRDKGIFVAYQAYEHDILVRPDPSIKEHVDHHEIMPHTGHLGPIRRADQVAKRVIEVVNGR